MILPPKKYPYKLKTGMAISEVEEHMKSMKGLEWERNDVNTITIYDVPFGMRSLYDLVCKFRIDDNNLYDIYYYKVSS